VANRNGFEMGLEQEKQIQSGIDGLPVILTTHEAEIRRIVVQSQPGQLV
jgi:hypothetical protein